MVRIKLNYFFFIWTILIPLAVGTLGMIIYWPAIHSHYWEVIMTPTMNIIGGYIVVFAFAWGIAAYIAIPWLAVIRGDRIVFHRLFRRKLMIGLNNIKSLEILSKKLPVERYKWSIGNLVFTMKNKNKHVVVGVPNYISIEIKSVLKSQEVLEYHRKLTDEEFDKYVVGKK